MNILIAIMLYGGLLAGILIFIKGATRNDGIESKLPYNRD